MTLVCADCLAEVDPQFEACPSCGFVRPANGWTPDPLTGLILGGRYRLEGRLGAGGMACVFRAARIGALGGHVAVKVLAPRYSRTVVAKRFEREAQVVARLTSPHVVRIYDFDTFKFEPSGGGAAPLYYIAMELIDGQTLGQLLRAQGKVNFLWGIDVLRQLARGLEEAHAQGIVHRDLKPSNVMLVQQRGSTHVKILDFGIAALAAREEAPSQEKLTQTGFVSGTPDYMAPEQAVGDPSVGPPADMFSLGVIAFEMFSGKKPFEGATMESLLARVTRPAPALREVLSDTSFPPELYRIVDKLLERDPKARYQHAGELLDDLGRFPTLQTTPDFVPPAELLERYASAAEGPSSKAQQASTRIGVRQPLMDATSEVSHARPRKGTSPWLWIASLVVLGGAATAVVIVLTSHPPAGPEAPPPTTIATSPDASATPPEPTPSDPTPPDPTSVPAALEGPRPPLDGAFAEVRLELGGAPPATLAIAAPVKLGPLYRPLPLFIALDRAPRALRIASGELRLELPGGGSISARGLGGPDGRLALTVPPRPSPDRYPATLELVLGGGERLSTKLVMDARADTFALP